SPRMLGQIAVDPSSERIAMWTGEGLFTVEGNALRPVVGHIVGGAAWLARAADLSPSPEPSTTTTTVGLTAAGDVDGDGTPDHLTLAGAAPDTTLVADLSRLGHQSIGVAVVDSPAILGIADVDKDGTGEIFVRIDQGASTEFFVIVKLVGGRLIEM